MNSAASSLNTFSATTYQMSGMQMLNKSKEAISKIKNVSDANNVINIIKSIHSKVLHKPFKNFYSVLPKALKNLSKEFKNTQDVSMQDLLEPIYDQIAWITGSQVCYCAEAFKGVSRQHPDAAALSVLATVLRNGFLHTAIREKGGAYGAGATNYTATNTFKIFSYRDPTCTETFSAFKEAIEWSKTSITNQLLKKQFLSCLIN